MYIQISFDVNNQRKNGAERFKFGTQIDYKYANVVWIIFTI